MKILKIINSKEEDIYSYTACISAVEFKKRGHEVDILTFPSDYVKDFCLKNKINFFYTDFLYLSGYKDIPEYDLIEIYNYTKIASLMLKKIFRKKAVKILKICSFYDESFKNFIKESIENISLIITITPSLKDELVFDGINENKIFSINPIIFGRWETAKQIRVFTTITRPYKIVTVFKKTKIDELKLFLSIAREIIKINQDVNFSIVGIKDENLRGLAREWGISHKIDMLGYRTDMPEVMAVSHIYLKPVLSADVSRSVFEAMYSGVVVVVSDIKGISDFIISDYNGIVVKRDDINQYVKSILSLINNPVKMETISTISYNYAMANFNAEIITKVEEIIYTELINEKMEIR
jgi:glycosyltransferase involved in cell wall biosynthesis